MSSTHALPNFQHENDTRNNVGAFTFRYLRAGELVQEAVHLYSSRNMAEQVTKMVIKVDLQCCRCYKKIKKILCEIPQVKDQSFDEKQNTVTITVVCCSPEKVRQKICCKGGEIILGIHIIQKPFTKDQSTQTKAPDTKNQSTQTTETCPTPDGPTKKPCPPPPVLGYPLVYVMGPVYVCPRCHNRGCGWSCPCNCHCRRPPMCDDGCGRPAHECRCGRPPMCHDGCGRPAHECRCQRHGYSRCCDQCNDENSSSSWTPYSCDCGRPPVCTNAGHGCESSCSHM